METWDKSNSDMAAFRYISGRGMVQDVVAEPLVVPASKLRINIVYTDLEATHRAVRRAVEMAIDLAAETQIIVPHVVPYPLPLEYPAVPLEVTCRQLKILAGAAGADPYITVYLCRDVLELLKDLLPLGSIVVLGARRRWFLPSVPRRMVRALQKKDCSLVIV